MQVQTGRVEICKAHSCAEQSMLAHYRMKVINIKDTQCSILIALTPELCVSDLQQVRIRLFSAVQCPIFVGACPPEKQRWQSVRPAQYRSHAA